MKYLSITTTLIPFIAAIALTGTMQDTLVHGLDQERSVTGNRKLKAGKVPKSTTVKSSKSTTVKSSNRVMNMWWIIINRPSMCTGGSTNPGEPACAFSDLRDSANGTNGPRVSILHASGGIPNKNGFLRMVASIYETQCDLDLVSNSGNGHYLSGGISYTTNYGLCPAAGEQPELHIVIRDHGPPTENQLWQMTRFTDPSCSVEGGPGNLCAGSGIASFGALNGDVQVTRSVGAYPGAQFEEAIQLLSGSEVTLIQTGSGYQVVAEINVPRV